MKIEKSTIIRTILILLVIVNNVLERCGIDIIPVDENFVGMFVENAIEVAVIITGFWYNNSFSPNARKAQAFFKELKNSK